MKTRAMDSNPSTTMKIKASTRARLAEYGKKSETFDDIINRLLDVANSNEKVN